MTTLIHLACFIMSTRHIVRISVLHTSILLTLIYCIVALFVTLIGTLVLSIDGGHDDFFQLITSGVDKLLAGALVNIVLVFLASVFVSLVYNFLAKYLGGIEITLDDD